LPAAALPDDPSLEQLKKQAKDLRDLAGAGVPGALDLVGAHHPKGAHPVTLTGAQLVVARHYGFASWARLKSHIATIERYRRDPDEVEPADDTADAFLVLACLRYGGDDHPDRWEQARALLARQPELVGSNVYVAAAAADQAALRDLLGSDPTLATREGGPYRWEPILYLAYARHDRTITAAATLTSGRLLLDHGADANAGYLWHGLYPPFTALTGALGSASGEHPEHPHGFALARMLLDAGTDPNDGQALYNRQFEPDDSHLMLLLEHGLGQGDGGPWARRFGHTADTPTDMVRGQLWWAIVHDMTARVQLLVQAGADIRSPYLAPGGRPSGLRTSHGKSPAQVAAMCGHLELAALLAKLGSPPPANDGVDALIAAALVGDRKAVERLAEHLDQAREQRPALIVWAASLNRPAAVELLAELGWDVNARGRTDIPMEQQWETALHEAAGTGNAELTRRLLELGADPDIEDTRFHSTPLGWARHFEQPTTIHILEPVTTPRVNSD
jgi:hypothetical protein